MDAMFNFSEEELNEKQRQQSSNNMFDESSSSSSTENTGPIKRPTSLNICKTTPELILRDSTNGGCKSEGSPVTNVQKRQQKKKKRRTGNSYSDVSFNDKYKLTEELLGTGAHGVVKTCRDRVTKQEYAVKIISKARHPNRTRVFKEIDIYYHCRACENILNIVDFLEDDEYFYLVFQKMEGGPLLNHIMKRGRLTEREACLIVRDIANGLNFLHAKGMSHRDLKPENILVERADSLLPIKLCDFDLGSAIRLNSNKTTPISTPALSTPVGSVDFMAPEVVDVWTSLEGVSQMYDKRCDLWSLGVIIYIMLSGYPPFYGTCGHTCGWTKGEECEQCQSSLFERIQKGEFDFPDKDWQYVSDDAKDLICRLLVRDASLRLTAAEVLKHPWITRSHELNEHPLHSPQLLQRHDSVRRLESFTKDAISISKMIEKRERMMAERSRSVENLPDRSRQTSEEPMINRSRPSNDDDDEDDEDDDDDDVDDDFDQSDSSVTRILKRRIRKKKKQTKSNDDQINFDHLRRRLSSATMTSGDDEDDHLACSYKTVIHRSPRFYLPESNAGSGSSPVTTYPVLVLPTSTLPGNLPLQHRAHTDTDLLAYNNQPTSNSSLQWYPPSPTLLYPNKTIPNHHGQQGSVRSSSADCRRTINHPIDEHQRLIPPERVW